MQIIITAMKWLRQLTVWGCFLADLVKVRSDKDRIHVDVCSVDRCFAKGIFIDIKSCGTRCEESTLVESARCLSLSHRDAEN